MQAFSKLISIQCIILFKIFYVSNQSELINRILNWFAGKCKMLPGSITGRTRSQSYTNGPCVKASDRGYFAFCFINLIIAKASPTFCFNARQRRFRRGLLWNVWRTLFLSRFRRQYFWIQLCALCEWNILIHFKIKMLITLNKKVHYWSRNAKHFIIIHIIAQNNYIRLLLVRLIFNTTIQLENKS